MQKNFGNNKYTVSLSPTINECQHFVTTVSDLFLKKGGRGLVITCQCWFTSSDVYPTGAWGRRFLGTLSFLHNFSVNLKLLLKDKVYKKEIKGEGGDIINHV